MTKKDYELIAGAFFTELSNIGGKATHYNYGRADGWRSMVYRMAVDLENANPKFDKEKFLTACGI